MSWIVPRSSICSACSIGIANSSPSTCNDSRSVTRACSTLISARVELDAHPVDVGLTHSLVVQLRLGQAINLGQPVAIGDRIAQRFAGRDHVEIGHIKPIDRQPYRVLILRSSTRCASQATSVRAARLWLTSTG